MRADDPWPPPASEIDLNDGSWLTIEQAAGYARQTPDNIRASVRRLPIAIKVLGRIWVKKDRLIGGTVTNSPQK